MLFAEWIGAKNYYINSLDKGGEKMLLRLSKKTKGFTLI